MSASHPLKINLAASHGRLKIFLEKHQDIATHVELQISQQWTSAHHVVDSFILIGEKLLKLIHVRVRRERLGFVCPVRALGELFSRRADTLEVLCLGKVGLRLGGEEKDFQFAFRQLSNAKKLKKFLMEDCSFSLGYCVGARQRQGSSAFHSGAMQSLFKALNKIATLSYVSVHAMDLSELKLRQISIGGLNKQKLMVSLWDLELPAPILQAMLAKDSRVIKLKLVDIHNINALDSIWKSWLKNGTRRNLVLSLQDLRCSGSLLQSILHTESRVVNLGLVPLSTPTEQIEQLVDGLQENCSIKELRVGTDTTTDTALSLVSGIRLLEVLADDNTYLQTLNLDIKCGKWDNLCFAPHMKRALEKTRSLKILRINVCDLENPQAFAILVPILQGLVKNESLTEVNCDIRHCIPQDISLEGLKKEHGDEIKMFEEALEIRNTWLKQFEVTSTREEEDCIKQEAVSLLSDTGLLYLKLNRAGRAHLEKDPKDRMRWIETLVRQKADLSMTYYLLTANLSVYFQGNPDDPPRPKKKRKFIEWMTRTHSNRSRQRAIEVPKIL